MREKEKAGVEEGATDSSYQKEDGTEMSKRDQKKKKGNKNEKPNNVKFLAVQEKGEKRTEKQRLMKTIWQRKF